MSQRHVGRRPGTATLCAEVRAARLPVLCGGTYAIGSRHVWVAHGRDYADVAPLKGIFTGGGESTLDVSVELTRLG